MIRNYQRASGGGTVDLVPIYNSLNAIQNEINSLITLTDLTTLTSISAELTGIDELSSSVTDLNVSVTALSTAFTSHTSYSDYRFRTFESGVKSSINSLSSSIMSINSIISTLSTATGGGGGGGVKTLTNPTESGHLFTDAVLYTGPDIDAPYGRTFDNAYNTYMQGVTWKDYPSTVTSVPDRTMPAYFGGCVVYGVLSYDNVYAYNLLSCTAQTVVVNNCNSGAIDGGSYSNISFNDVSLARAVGTINTISASDVNVALFSKATCDSILLSKCNSAIISSVYANHLYIPYCSMISLDKCRVKDISIDYPSTVTSYNSDYAVTLESNTIDKINASLLRCTVNNNDIWTANLYMDYDLMQSSMFSSAGYFNGNTINELSIFNNDHGTGNTTNNAISINGIYLGNNSLNQMICDLYSPFTVSGNTIGTLDNTLGVSLSAVGNRVQEWGCEVSPFSALLHNTTTTKTFALMQSNTISKWDFYHGLTIDSLITDTSLSNQITAALNSLSIYALQNSASYVTFDVMNPLTVNFNSYLFSAQFNVANKLTFAVSESIGTLNMINNERFVTVARDADIRAFNAHSVGMTNIYPRFVAADNSIDILDMYMDGVMSASYSLSNITANSLNIKNFAKVNVTSRFNVDSCIIQRFHYEQLNVQRLRLQSNTIEFATVDGGYWMCETNFIDNVSMNISAAALGGNTLGALGGSATSITMNGNSLTLGGLYYGYSQGSLNTVVRLNTGM